MIKSTLFFKHFNSNIIINSLKFNNKFQLNNLIKYYSNLSNNNNNNNNYNNTNRLSIAIIGAGPGGFYTANKLLKLYNFDENKIQIDLFEKYPTPYGLVRYGVAPDHPEVKSCINKFEEILNLPNVQYFGNIEIGKELSIRKLQEYYHNIIIATGANDDKTFNLPGESNENVLSARSFVGWYNGDPNYTNLITNLDKTDTAVILGQGNVALDVARILLAPIDYLKTTDITEYALQALSQSKIKNVKIVGRRGPLQVSFTSKELREMFTLNNVSIKLDENLFKTQLESNLEQLNNRGIKRLMNLMEKGLKENQLKYNKNSPALKTCEFQFLRSPLEFLINEESNELNGIKFGLNELISESHQFKAKFTGETVIEKAGLVFRSIGYKSTAIKDIPFDYLKNIIPNNQGKIITNNNENSNLYTSGWIKTGPIGVIATTMMNAFETADKLYNDFKGKELNLNKSGLLKEDLVKFGLNPINYKDWKLLDQYEIELGKKLGKPREKVTNINDMLNIIKA